MAPATRVAAMYSPGSERLLPPGRTDRQGALMLKWLPSGRRAWCLAAALLALAGLAWHFEAASRLDPEALEPRPGPLVLDRTGRLLRLVPGAQGGKLVTLPDESRPRTGGRSLRGRGGPEVLAPSGHRSPGHPPGRHEQPEPRPHRVRGFHPHPATGPPHLPRAPQLLSQAGGGLPQPQDGGGPQQGRDPAALPRPGAPGQ